MMVGYNKRKFSKGVAMELISDSEFTIIEYAQAYTVLLRNVPLDWGMTLDEAKRLIADLAGELWVKGDANGQS